VPEKTIAITVNGLKHDIKIAETISYTELCRIAVQPVDFGPSVKYVLYPGDKPKSIRCGQAVPLVEGASYTVKLTGR
jgi:hypothetical protein